MPRSASFPLHLLLRPPRGNKGRPDPARHARRPRLLDSSAPALVQLRRDRRPEPVQAVSSYAQPSGCHSLEQSAPSSSSARQRLPPRSFSACLSLQREPPARGRVFLSRTLLAGGGHEHTQRAPRPPSFLEISRLQKTGHPKRKIIFVQCARVHTRTETNTFLASRF